MELKWEPKLENGAKRDQNGAKGVQNGAKRAQKGAKSGQKREPKGDQNASKSRPSEKVAKRSPKGSPRQDEMGAFLVQKPSKIHPKIDAKIDAEKVMKFHEKLTKK